MHRPRSVRDADVFGKNVLARVDFNVPLENGRVADDTRIRAALPTIRLLLDGGVQKLRLCSHLGRPKGEDPAFSLQPVEEHLRTLVDDPRIAVLENTRFHPGETKNDPQFARELADGCDLYVDDAFGSAHRAHASTEAVAHLLPAYAGLLLERELEELSSLLEEPSRPFVAVLGGAKVEDKIGVLESLAEKADAVLVGGKMAEKVEPRDKVLLPLDVVAASAFEADADAKIVAADAVPEGWLGLDVGPKTREMFAAKIASAGTVFWNGPMGVFEWPRFADGTEAVAKAVAAFGWAHGGRRRRLSACRAGAGSGGADRLGVDGRRGLARVPRGQGAPGGRRHPGGLICTPSAQPRFPHARLFRIG